MINVRHKDKPLIRCKQELRYCCHVKKFLYGDAVVCDGVTGLEYQILNKRYTGVYTFHGGTYKTRALKFKKRQRTSVTRPLLVR